MDFIQEFSSACWSWTLTASGEVPSVGFAGANGMLQRNFFKDIFSKQIGLLFEILPTLSHRKFYLFQRNT